MEPDSPPNFIIENWLHFLSHQNKESQTENNDDDEEALSLSDLATSKHEHPETNQPQEQSSDDHEEDFDFGGAGTTLPESKMCSADELFFRGQILPLTQTSSFTSSFSFSESEPPSVVNSRSSSTRSNYSGTSGSSSTSSFSGSDFTGYKPTIQNRNQFHSHPSPTPQIRTRNIRHSNPKTTSSKWSFLQLGVLNPQEIGLAELKNRRHRSNSMKNQNNQNKKKMQMSLLGGCTCSSNAIENTVFARIPMVKPTSLKEEETKSRISKESNVGRRKHAVSSHRTSEWLKQLSIQDSATL